MKRDILTRIMGLWLTLLLLTACSHEEKGGNFDDCYLTIYVYSPSKPIVTRSDVGYQAASPEEENAVHRLQLWVYKHNSGDLVGYLDEKDVDFDGANSSTFRVVVSPEFADAPENVDVFAIANVAEANTGHVFNRKTTRSELEAAVLEGKFFGQTAGAPIQEIPEDGLPMSGVLRNKGVEGSFPALRIVNEDQMATVRLVRAVSKVRFLLCRAHDPVDKDKQLTAITSIELNANQISAQEHLMLTEPYDYSINPTYPLGASRIHIVPGDYEEEVIKFGGITGEGISRIPIDETPTRWLYNESTYGTVEAYNTAIENAINKTPQELVPFGVTYLRETDKRIQGMISYRVASDDERAAADRQAVFELNKAGDFTRNHSWTVLILFEGGQIYTINVVDIGIRDWTSDDTPENHAVYNW